VEHRDLLTRTLGTASLAQLAVVDRTIEEFGKELEVIEAALASF